jgi:hypothetical protein
MDPAEGRTALRSNLDIFQEILYPTKVAMTATCSLKMLVTVFWRSVESSRYFTQGIFKVDTAQVP